MENANFTRCLEGKGVLEMRKRRVAENTIKRMKNASS
jgi:hypothetical protein